MGHIFISYSHKDKDYVHKLQAALQIEGFDVWIDERIDYGREWPKVIQENLDSCGAFIVVMSKNAYESDMVQNEVARAREKKKHILSLLLDGENWLIFQAKQYVDVRGEKLPPSQFYEKLEDFVERQEIIDPKHFSNVTQHWKSYKNKKYAFIFQYPLGTEIVIDKMDEIRINFPMVPGTNLHSKYITVDIMEGEPCSNPLTKDWFDAIAGRVNRKKVRIGKLMFLREIGEDGGMSKWEQWVSYSTSRKTICVSMTIHTIVTSDGPRYPHELPKIDVDADKEVILKTASTFRWLDDKE